MRVASVTSSLVAIALIASCVAVASSAMAQAPGAVTPITDSSASSSTAAAQNPAPATQAEAPKVPTPVAPVRWSDLESGSTTASGVSVPRVDFFDPRVWDYDYYMNEHPLLRTKFGINTVRKAKEHWLREGIRVGLRGSAKFSAVEYLDRNADVRERFGDGNYPFAIIHYLRRGVHELYRETGGPLRLNIFDARAFDWAWYAANEPLAIAANVGGSEERARAHWRDFGLPAGAMGSVHLNLTAYVDGNADVRAMYGRNYAAALSHWIEVGHLETWRPTGGRACTFWSTWCQRPDGLLFELLSRRPDLPVLNSSDGALSAATLASAPVPVSAGVQVRINGRTCSDLSDMRTLPSGWARAVRATRVMFPGRGATRPCDITVRFATDVQVSTNDQPMPELALTHWDFDDSAPAYVKAEPAGATPDQMMYEGWHWVHKPSEGEVDPNFNGTFTGGSDLSTDLDYVITSWRYEDVGREKIAEEKLPSGHFPRLPVTELWTAVHHYTYRRNAKFYNDFESPEGNRGVAYDDIAQRRPLATRPRIPTHDQNVSVPFAGQLPIELRRHFPAGLPPLHAARPLFVDDVLLGKVSPAEVGIAPSPMQQLLDEFAPYEDFARSLGVNTPSTPDYPTRAPHSPRYNFADSLAKPLPLHWDAWPAGVNNQHLYTPPAVARAANATKA